MTSRDKDQKPLTRIIIKKYLLIALTWISGWANADEIDYQVQLNIFSGFANPVMDISSAEFDSILATISTSLSIKKQSSNTTLFPYNGMSIYLVQNNEDLIEIAALKGGILMTPSSKKGGSAKIQYISKASELLILDMALAKKLITPKQYTAAINMVMNVAKKQLALETTEPLFPPPSYKPQPPTNQ